MTARWVERALSKLRSMEPDPDDGDVPTLDPSRLTDAELTEVQGFLRAMRGLPAETPTAQAERQAREQEGVTRSYKIPPDDEHAAREPDPARLSPRQRHRLRVLMEKTTPNNPPDRRSHRVADWP